MSCNCQKMEVSISWVVVAEHHRPVKHTLDILRIEIIGIVVPLEVLNSAFGDMPGSLQLCTLWGEGEEEAGEVFKVGRNEG